MERCRNKLLLYVILGLLGWPSICVNMQVFDNVTILSSPAGTPVSGSTNTFSYRILSSVTLTCDAVPSPTNITNIQWITDGCTGCFPSNQTTQMVAENTLTPEDAGTFNCSLQEGSGEYFSSLFTLVVDYAPSNVIATVLTARSVEVTWDAFPVSSGVTGYLISYTTTASYTSGGSVPVNNVTTASYILTNLEEYTNYTITVQATSSSGMSGNSNEVLVTTDTAAPSSPPQSVMLTDVDPASLRVTWQPPPLIDQNGPLVGYTISYHRTDDFLNTQSMGATGNETIISGLDPNVSYSVQVSARNDRGLGIASSIMNQISGQDIPTEPRSLTAVDSTDTTMTLSWMEPDMPNGIIIRYQVEYRVTSTDQSSILLQNATSLITILTRLLPYTEYRFRVAGVTRVGIGPYTNFTANFTTVPAPTVNIRALENQTVGQSLMLQCDVIIADDGNTRSVNIVWSNDVSELERMDDVFPASVGNSVVYTHLYTTPQLTTSDDGTVIQCEANVTETTSVLYRNNITLDVTVPLPIITISPPGPIQGAMVGSPEVINCTVSTVSGVESNLVMISWMGPGGSSIISDSRVTIITTTSSGNSYTSTLQFTYLLEDDNGTYTCNVMILETSEAASVNLSILSVPGPTVTVTTLNNQTVGQSLTLQCEVTTPRGITSRVDIVWSSDGTVLMRINDTTAVTIDNSSVYTESYNILQLSTTDDGRMIQCEVVINTSPSVMARDSIILDVNFPPPNVSVTALSDQTVGQSLTLQCEATTVRGITSGVDIVWISNGTVLRRTNDATATTMGNSSVFRESYMISMLTTSYNARMYECEVVINANPPMTVSDNIILNVNVPDPSIIIQPPGPITGAMVGSPLNSNCIVSTVDGVESNDVLIRWTGPGVSMNRFIMGNITSLGNNTYSRTLRLDYLLKTDEGINHYFCIATILEASAIESFELESLADPDPPVVIISPPGPIENATVGRPQTLTCMATTTMTVRSDLLTFMWIKQGEGIITSNGRVTIQPVTSMNNMYMSVLQFNDLIESDGGIYICNVTFLYVNGSDSVEIETPDYAPTNVMAMVLTPRSVMVTWTPSHPITNVTMYIIHYMTTVSYTDSGNMTVNGINTTTGILPDLEENTPYTITVQAVSYRRGMMLLSGFSNEVPVITFTDVPSSPPTNIIVMSAHPGSLNISWEPPAEINQNGPITDYVIRYSRVGSNVTMDEIVTSSNIYTITELYPFVNYSVEMAAINVNGTGPYSDPIVELSGHEEPSVPRSLMFNFISFTTITVSWMPPLMPNGLITRYDLEFKELNDTLFTRRFPSANRRNYTITDLTPNTIYVIRIAAVTVVGRGPFTTNMTNITLTPNIAIVSSPAGIPVSGSDNTFDYPILSSVTLICMVDPMPLISVTYSWNTTRCYTNAGYSGGNPQCFPDGETTQNVTGNNLNAEDAGTITCTVTISNIVYTSEPFTLRISGVAAIEVMYNADGTVTSSAPIFANSLTDYSYINARDGDPNGAQLARCMTGLGPSGNDNNALGVLYFNESRISNGVCGSSVVQPNGASIDDFVGVIDMFQCGEFSPSVEGVYTCTMMNSSMIDQSIRLGIYYTGRTAPDVDEPSPPNITADVGATITLSCISRGSPPDTFMWQREDDPMMLQSTSIGALEHTSTSAVFQANYTIDSVDFDNNGTYTCIVINPIGSDNATITVIAIIPEPPTIIISPSGPIQGAMVGSPQDISCTAITPTLLDVVFNWTGPNGNIVDDSRVTISQTVVNGDNYTSVLQFAYLMEGDEGNYTCVVSLLSVNNSGSVEISPLTVPTPTVSVTNTSTQTVGQSLTLQCEVTTVRGITSRVDIVWSSNGTELQRMDNVSSDTMGDSLLYTGSYTIPLLSTTHDGGVYECEAVINSSPSATTAMDNITLGVIVPTPDVIVTALNNQTVSQNLTLQCEVTTVRGITSRVDLVWSSNDTVLRRINDTTATTVGNSSVYTDSYIIQMLNTSDHNRRITCEAVVDVDPTVIGRGDIVLDVIVPISPIIITLDPAQDAMVGSPQVMECLVSTVVGVDPNIVMISWTGPSGSIMNDSRRIIMTTTDNDNNYTSVLQFTYLMEEDEGEYTCIVTILETSEMNSVQLENLEIPNPTVNVTAPGDQTVGQLLILQCEVTTVRGINSRVSIEWIRDGDMLQMNNSSPSSMTDDSLIHTNSYTIDILSTDDEDRTYSCEVVINASPPVMASDSVTLDVIVPTPTVSVTAPNTQTVGQSLTLQCEVNAVRGITSRVDIVWSSDGKQPEGMNGVLATLTGNSLVYTDSYTISPLSTDDENRVYRCDVVINADPMIMANNNITLDVTVPEPTVNVSVTEISRFGSPQVIICTVSTVNGVEFSSVMISWMGPGGSSVMSGNRVTISQTTSSSNIYSRSLQFDYLVEADNGTYICNTEILDVTVSASLVLESFLSPDPFNISTMPASPIQDGIVGNRQVIDCIATTHVAVDVSLLNFYWMGPRGNITNSDRIAIQPTNPMNNMYVSSLQFDYLLVIDEGNYTCNVQFFDAVRSATVFMERPDYAPSNVTATVLTSRRVQVTWDPPAPVSNVTSYIIVYTTTASYASDGSLTVHGYNTTRGTLNDLEENTLYTIIVQAFANSSGRSGDSEEATVTTYTDVPSASPRNVEVVTLHPGALNVSWQPPPEGDQNGPLIYVVEYTDIQENTAVNDTVFRGTTLVISALDPFDDYSVRVAARTVNGTGRFSDPVMETSGHEEPSMPRSLMAIGVSYTTMTLSWTEPEMPNGHITSYHLQYRITDNTNSAFHILFPINNATTRTVTRLVPGTNYTLRISAVTIIGRGPYTSIITNRTLSPVPTVISSPAGSPASGFTNTFDYPMLSSVTLTCMVDPMPSSIATVNYRWSATECYTKGGNRRCFPDGQMTQNVNDNDLTLEDAGTITCTVTINGRSYASQPFTLRISVHDPIVTVFGPEQATVGNPLAISCTANTISGIDASLVIFSWRGPRGDLTMNNDRVNINQNTSGDNSHTSYLQLTYVVRGDQGIYTCNVTILHTNATVERSHEIRRLNATGPPVHQVVTVITTPYSANITWIVPFITFDHETYLLEYGNDMSMLDRREIMGNTDLFTINQTFAVPLTGLSPFTEYYYILNATNSNGTTTSGRNTFTTDETVPASFPSNFKVTDIRSTSVAFQWDPLTDGANGRIRSYKIMCTNQNGDNVMASVGGDVTMATVLGLNAFTDYSCTVRAVTVLDGPESDPASVTTREAASTPPIIDTVTDINSTTVRVTWEQPEMPNGMITLYTITYTVDGDSTDLNVSHTGESQSYDITGLSPYQLVTVTITATNGGGTSNSSNAVVARTSESVPGVVEVNNTFEEMVFWIPPSEPNGIITNYQVLYYIYQNDTGKMSVMLDNSTTTYAIQGLNAGIPYEVIVVAFTGVGKGEENDRKIFFYKELPPTKAPEDVGSKLLNLTSFNITWDPLTLFEARGFPEYRVVATPKDTNRRKRQSESNTGVQTMMTEGSFVVFTGLRQNTDFSVVVAVRTGNGTFLEAPPLDVTTRLPATNDDDSDSPLALIIGVSAGGAIVLVILLIVLCCFCMSRRTRSRSYSPRGLFKNTGFIRTSFHRASFSKRNEQTLIGTDYSNDDSVEREHTTFQMVTIPTRKGKNNGTASPISLKDFSVHVAAMHRGKNHGFEIEYESIGNCVASADIAKLPANRMKNRYANIFAYDDSRVILHGNNDNNSNYINASFIDGYNKPNAYIASQGPIPETLDDFWQMIWDQQSPTIVMLTKLVEGNKPKCMRYWPENVGESITPKPSLKVTLTQQRVFADYEVRTIQVALTSEPDSAPLEINHFFYTGWPDHGVPKYATGVISFIKRVRQSHPKDGPPMIVHCSAGVGRTGAFIVLDIMLERIPQTHDINVLECVQELRAKRMSMVQTAAQYIFIHDALDEIINCGETAFNAHNMSIKMKKLLKVSPETRRNGFDDQFELLEKVSRPPSPDECSAALSEENKDKNFSLKAIPFDDSRVCLYGSSLPGSDYINASFIDGYKHRNAYIATQCPMVPTVDSFWRMLWEYKSAVVVTLCSPQHDKEDFLQYWPARNTEYETFKVALTTSESSSGYDSYKFVISNQQENSLEVTMFHYTDWPANGVAKDTNALLNMIKQVVEIQRSRPNRPVTVMCSDGCARTGTFIAICYTLDRINIEGTVDIFHAVKLSRICRAGLVGNADQYKYCYDVVSEFMEAAVF